MKYIKKHPEPKSLAEYRVSISTSYPALESLTSRVVRSIFDNLDKAELKDSLLQEQGNICCYCMRSIMSDKMRVEHWEPLSKSPQKSLDYKNLLASCTGNEKSLKHLWHCDKKKDNERISINPTDPKCEELITFNKSGKISSTDRSIEHDLNCTLNLNIQTLKDNRAAAYDLFFEKFQRDHKSTWRKEIIIREIERWSKPPYKEYCQIVIFFLKKKLKKIERK